MLIQRGKICVFCALRGQRPDFESVRQSVESLGINVGRRWTPTPICSPVVEPMKLQVFLRIFFPKPRLVYKDTAAWIVKGAYDADVHEMDRTHGIGWPHLAGREVHR